MIFKLFKITYSVLLDNLTKLIKSIIIVSTEFDNQNLPHPLEKSCEKILEHFLSNEQYKQNIDDEIRTNFSSITAKEDFIVYDEKYFWNFQSQIIKEIFD